MYIPTGTCVDIPYGLVVRIPGFHPGGPGSIPGVGTSFFFFFFLISITQAPAVLLCFQMLFTISALQTYAHKDFQFLFRFWGLC